MNILMCALVLTISLLPLKLFNIQRWSPAMVFCLFWYFQFIVCYLFFRETPWSVTTACYIALCFVSIQIGSRIKLVPKKSSFIDDQGLVYNERNANGIIVASLVLGFAYAVIEIYSNGFSLSSFSNLDSLFNMNNEFATSRYSQNGGASNIALQILLSFVYFLPLAGGYNYVVSDATFGKQLSILSLMPELIVLLTTNIKNGMIACVILFFVGYLVASIRKNGGFKLTHREILTSLFTIGLILLLLVFSMFLRIGKYNDSVVSVVLSKLEYYSFGHVAAFDNWFDNHFLHSELMLGQQTFIGIVRYFTDASRVQGVFTDNYIGPELRTNIYTYFRGLYSDFGLLGTIVFFIGIGMVSSSSILTIKKYKNNSSLAETVLVIIFTFILYFMVSFFSYVSFIVVFVWFYLFLRLTERQNDLIKVKGIRS